ncbi:transcription factor IBH1-like 1 [Cucurbita pepo subsp. pepo]|uniref:transcription factor IBH1-like 1 n=1 Tax=Cucurbita pepo subsp. pepo TaxID=3664 RepID=UPI000C9D4DD7|nr:transcription factor IBH1-like 1 [Cucurbita pepo subsp. pepo]
MSNPNSLKRDFLKKWLMGLQIYTTTNRNMTVADRKRAIKLSADIALASSRNCATRWSRAVIAGTSVHDGSFLVANGVLGRAVCERIKESSSKITRSSWCSGKILKRSRRVGRRKKCRKAGAEWIAKRLVQKRTRMLRGLVPGGEFMDEVSLIEETLDYILALQTQVDVMRCLATTAYVAPPSL